MFGCGVTLDTSAHPVAENEEEEGVLSTSPDECRRDTLFDLGRHGLRLVEGVEFLDIGPM